MRPTISWFVTAELGPEHIDALSADPARCGLQMKARKIQKLDLIEAARDVLRQQSVRSQEPPAKYTAGEY